jgi:PPM family protein phosphatase
LRIEVGARTSVGRVRENNEDAYLVAEPEKLFVVSDGMGGEAHGEVASALTVKTIVEQCKAAMDDSGLTHDGIPKPDLSARANRLASAVRAANRAIFHAAAADESHRGMGATVVAAWLDTSPAEGPRLSIAHVGDSRIYLLGGGGLKQLTSDHSLVAEQVRHGLLTREQAAISEFQNVLTRALGPREEVKVDAADHQIAIGDSLLLCTDGVTRLIADDEIALMMSKAASAQASADQLIATADERGGPDNSTAIVVRLLP